MSKDFETHRLETERLVLRPWEESDAESLYEYAKNPLVGPIAGWPVHTSVENSREIIKNVLSAEGTYAVCLKEDNRAIGSIGLIKPEQSHVNIGEDEIEVGYWIGVPFWGQGFIPEALKKLQEYAFLELDFTAMWCGYYDGNEKSKRCQEKCGFVYHHTEENKPCTLMGDVRTEHFTRLTKKAWKSNARIREANYNDLEELLQLYLYLHEKSVPEDSEELRSTWDVIIHDENHHLIVCEVDGKLVASCVCVIIPNLTRNIRPYAFIENVVTHGEYRKKGYATECLNYAKKIAEQNHCYKMMLLTGSKEESTLNFYRNAGYNSSDKTAFIQRIN